MGASGVEDYLFEELLKGKEKEAVWLYNHSLEY